MCAISKEEYDARSHWRRQMLEITHKLQAVDEQGLDALDVAPHLLSRS